MPGITTTTPASGNIPVATPLAATEAMRNYAENELGYGLAGLETLLRDANQAAVNGVHYVFDPTINGIKEFFAPKSQITGVQLTDTDRAQMAQMKKYEEMRKIAETVGVSPELLSILYENMLNETPAASGTTSGTPAPETSASGTGTAAPAEGTASGTASGAAPTAEGAAASANPDRSRIGKIADAVVGGAKGAVQGVKDGYKGTGNTGGNSEQPKNEGGDDKKGNGGKKLLEILPGYGYRGVSTGGKVARGIRDFVWGNIAGPVVYDMMTNENTAIGKMMGKPVERNDNTNNVQRVRPVNGNTTPSENRHTWKKK